jgi:hypothetical protein
MVSVLQDIHMQIQAEGEQLQFCVTSLIPNYSFHETHIKKALQEIGTRARFRDSSLPYGTSAALLLNHPIIEVFEGIENSIPQLKSRSFDDKLRINDWKQPFYVIDPLDVARAKNYKEDIVDSLSLELAKAKNDKKVIKPDDPYCEVDCDTKEGNMGGKVRDAKNNKVPYIIIIGDKDIEANKISVESRDKGQLGQMDIKDFIQKIKMIKFFSDFYQKINFATVLHFKYSSPY